MEKVKKSSSVLEIVKALIIAVILSLVLVLLAALIIKLFNLNSNVIPIINQIIKGISILLGCVIALKSRHGCWVRGIIVGIFYIALAYVIFSLLDGKFAFGIGLLNDVVLGSVSGMISGILAGLKKPR